MARWVVLFLILAAGSGCGHMEDMVFGPDPYAVPGQPWPGTSACSQAPPAPTVVQTQEPPR